MKRIVFPCLVGLVLACAQSPASAQEFKEHITKEFTLAPGGANKTLAIYNVNGFIKVEGYSGDKVVLEIDKSITAKNSQTLETGKQELKLQFEQKGDSILAYIAEPFDSRPSRSYRQRDKEVKYDFTLNYTVKVPNRMSLAVSTINRGTVTVKDVAGSLWVRNVNGAITLTNVKGATDAHTINGDVDINYLVSPPDQSTYYTLNGNIHVTYPATLSADLQFKSFHGDFFTDFSNTEMLPMQVTKNQEQRGDGTVYKLHTNTAVRIGKGGQQFKFETFNGNIYIKKQS